MWVGIFLVFSFLYINARINFPTFNSCEYSNLRTLRKKIRLLSINNKNIYILLEK